MLVLPYCVYLGKSIGKIPAKGVLDAEVQAKQCGPLVVLYSEIERSRIAPETFQQSALEFHRVVHAVFDSAAVIPFRFPTWLSAEELADHLQKESERYQAFLTLHADHVQMELRVTQPSSESLPAPSSGTEHLRARAARLHQSEKAVEGLKTLFAPEVLEWRERDIPEGKRLYALVERGQVAHFRERLSQRSVRWSGPWPATEFLGN